MSSAQLLAEIFNLGSSQQYQRDHHPANGNEMIYLMNILLYVDQLAPERTVRNIREEFEFLGHLY